MGIFKSLVRVLLTFINFLHNLISSRKKTIAEPGYILNKLLDIYYGNEKLFKLEFLTDFYQKQGLFRYDNKIYIFESKLAQSAINKLEKGAQEYLKDSPLKNTFLGSSSRSPAVRRHIAEIFRKSNLEQKGDWIIKDVENMCERMAKEAKCGDAVNLTEWSLRMAMDVVGHMLLQLDLCALEGNQQSLLESLMTILHRCYALDEIKPDSEEFKHANETFEKITTKILSDALQKDDKSDEKRLVTKLHEACGFELARDNMKLFLMAGSETTASSIPVLFYLLSTFTDVQDELRQEADEHLDNLRKDPSFELPKLEAVLRELLRVYPIAPFISRQAHNDISIGNITLKAQSDIIVFTWGIHRSRYQWTSSKEFVPFRFLNVSHRSSSMYIPFGAGSRVCIGQHLAWLELKIATAILLHKFKFSKVQSTPTLKFVVDWAHAVIHPDKDMLFKLELR